MTSASTRADDALVWRLLHGSALGRASSRLHGWFLRSRIVNRGAHLMHLDDREAGPRDRVRRAAQVTLIASVAALLLPLAVMSPEPYSWVMPAGTAIVATLALLVAASRPAVDASPGSGRRVRVLALSPIPVEGAGCRFRVAQYLPHLRSVGFDVTLSPFYTREFFQLVYRPGHHVRKALLFLVLAWRRARELASIGNYDLVFLYREAIPLGPPLVERFIAARGIPIVYDFDDAIFLPSVSDANRAIGFLKNPGRVATVLRLSSAVIVGNEFLAQYARRYNPAVTVIPTAVDTTRFVPRTRPRDPDGRPLVVGWIGSPTTFPYLESLAGILREVSDRTPFVLRVSGAGRPVRFPGLTVVEEPWSLEAEVHLFNTCDIGVYPLADDEWAKGKCGFKAIQFMACGVPVVAAAVGVNREIVRDEVNGFLAATREEWIEKLGRLLVDAPLRERLAAEGRRTIEAGYALSVTAPRLAAVCASVLGRAPAAVRAEI